MRVATHLLAALIGGLLSAVAVLLMDGEPLAITATRAIVADLTGGLESYAVTNDYLERASALRAESLALRRVLHQRDAELEGLRREAERAAVSEAETEEVVAEVREELESLPPAALEPCEVPMQMVAAQDLRIKALVAQRDKQIELIEEFEIRDATWKELVDTERARADLGKDTVGKLTKRKFRIRPAVFAGITRSFGDDGKWGPMWGVGFALTYGR